MSDSLIIVGRVRKAHGIRGDLVVESMTDAPDDVFTKGRRLLAGDAKGDRAKNGAELHIASASPFKGGFIVHFDEIDDRTIAETWRDRYLLLPADELEPIADDEVYVHELIGMRVELESGEPVGTVTDTYELPQGLGLDIQRSAGSVIVLYEQSVVGVDRAARVIRIAPPAGLLDD